MSFYIAPRFLDKLSVHITKNFLNIPNLKVPLILGVHGRKGEGKTFMCELVFKRMGIGVVYMSAGELESPDAGDPARLIRLRYREAGEWSRVYGRMAVLMINDLDAGAGRVDQSTQYTVNTQLVNATLMNIADNPTNVQLPGSYDEKPTQRIPIIATGNDFATLYAPLTRDGRMEKFYWEPDRTDRVGIVSGIFQVDAIAHEDIVKLVEAFPSQSIDFFGALRSRLYDEQVRAFIHTVGVDKISTRVVNSLEASPEFRKPDFSLPHLIEMGSQMVQEQEHLSEMRLMYEYNAAYQAQLGSDRAPSASASGEPKRETGRSRPTPLAPANTPPAPEPKPTPAGDRNGHAATLSPEQQEHLQHITRQGHKLGIEYVDARRFQTNAWQCYAVVSPADQALEEAIATLQNCLAEHPADYIRLVAIDPKDRRRLTETIIQRPTKNG